MNAFSELSIYSVTSGEEKSESLRRTTRITSFETLCWPKRRSHTLTDKNNNDHSDLAWRLNFPVRFSHIRPKSCRRSLSFSRGTVDYSTHRPIIAPHNKRFSTNIMVPSRKILGQLHTRQTFEPVEKSIRTLTAETSAQNHSTWPISLERSCIHTDMQVSWESPAFEKHAPSSVPGSSLWQSCRVFLALPFRSWSRK